MRCIAIRYIIYLVQENIFVSDNKFMFIFVGLFLRFSFMNLRDGMKTCALVETKKDGSRHSVTRKLDLKKENFKEK